MHEKQPATADKDASQTLQMARQSAINLWQIDIY